MYYTTDQVRQELKAIYQQTLKSKRLGTDTQIAFFLTSGDDKAAKAKSIFEEASEKIDNKESVAVFCMAPCLIETAETDETAEIELEVIRKFYAPVGNNVWCDDRVLFDLVSADEENAKNLPNIEPHLRLRYKTYTPNDIRLSFEQYLKTLK